MADILLKKINNVYDYVIENKDLKLDLGLDTTITNILFTDRRASPSQISVPELRRGWIGNEQNKGSRPDRGSLLWLVYQSRLNQKSLNDAILYTKQALQIMIDDKLVKEIEVAGIIDKFNTVIPNSITLNVVFIRFNSTTFSKQFELWENTFKEAA